MPTARLPDGREVDTASPEWRAHCLSVWLAEQKLVDRHVGRLQRIETATQRREYLAQLEQSEGKALADRVRVDFGKWFDEQKKRRAAARSTPTG